MKLTIIGHWGGYPKANEASSGYLLEQGDYRLLIDCGSGVLSKLQPILQPNQLDGVIVSHYHPDHVADIGVLQHARLIEGLLGKEMDCLPIYSHAYNEYEFSKLTYKNITKGIAYQPDQALCAGPFMITFLKTDHPVDCFAMRFETDRGSLVYTADTAFKEELITFSKDVDLLLCECNFYSDGNGSNVGHMTSIDAGRLANSANVKRLLLTHLPHYGRLEQLKEEAATQYKGPVSLSQYGLSFTI